MGEQKTTLDPIKIKELVKNKYGIIVKRIEPINRGTANLYKIQSKDGDYILKEFTSKRNKQTIIKEINIIKFLKSQNLKVPEYIETVEGDFCTENEGRIIIMQKFIKGYEIKNNTGNFGQTMKSAEVYGKLVKTLAKYPEMSTEKIIENNFSKGRMIDQIGKIQVLLKKCEEVQSQQIKEQIQKDLKFKILVSQEILDNFDFSIMGKITMMNSHGDYSVQQLIFDKKEQPTIIDFEKAKKLPIIWEIIRSYCYVDKDAKNGEINMETLKQYFLTVQKYVKLNQYDLKYAAKIYLIQLISSTYGYKEYLEDNSHDELLQFALFRTKTCRYLYKHADEIGEVLEKIGDYHYTNEVKKMKPKKDQIGKIENETKSMKFRYTYNKLVRDKIPAEINKEPGRKCQYKILEDKEYLKELNKKVIEEANEFIEENSISELGDLIEVIRAIMKIKGYTMTEVEKVMKAKVERKGAFNDKIFLEYVDEEQRNLKEEKELNKEFRKR